jgi:hypothetical protein
MTTVSPTRTDVQALLREVTRYLAAVDAFRAEGCEPSWQGEGEPAGPKRRRGRALPVA